MSAKTRQEQGLLFSFRFLDAHSYPAWVDTGQSIFRDPKVTLPPIRSVSKNHRQNISLSTRINCDIKLVPWATIRFKDVRFRIGHFKCVCFLKFIKPEPLSHRF